MKGCLEAHGSKVLRVVGRGHHDMDAKNLVRFARVQLVRRGHTRRRQPVGQLLTFRLQGVNFRGDDGRGGQPAQVGHIVKVHVGVAHVGTHIAILLRVDLHLQGLVARTGHRAQLLALTTHQGAVGIENGRRTQPP